LSCTKTTDPTYTNQNGNTCTNCLPVSGTEGLNENQRLSFKLYPNPTSGSLTLEFEDENQKKVHLYDMYGRIVESFETNSSIASLNLREVKKGTYIVVLEINERLGRELIVIE